MRIYILEILRFIQKRFSLDTDNTGNDNNYCFRTQKRIVPMKIAYLFSSIVNRMSTWTNSNLKPCVNDVRDGRFTWKQKKTQYK